MTEAAGAGSQAGALRAAAGEISRLVGLCAGARCEDTRVIFTLISYWADPHTGPSAPGWRWPRQCRADSARTNSR
jgi:hypothetical protein